jgi:hypothetical protein
MTALICISQAIRSKINVMFACPKKTRNVAKRQAIAYLETTMGQLFGQ